LVLERVFCCGLCSAVQCAWMGARQGTICREGQGVDLRAGSSTWRYTPSWI
jgi:hypothetical protein